MDELNIYTSGKTKNIRKDVSGVVAWQAPSNIAFVKYWGKKRKQLPRNPSLSMALKNSYTQTRIEFSYTARPRVAYFFENQPNPAFASRVNQYISAVSHLFPFLRHLDLSIHSENTFPHSAGIASSASAFCSLALCLCDIENMLFGTLSQNELFNRKASFTARLGSGSACRSVYAPFALWGKTKDLAFSSDEYAVPVDIDLHPFYAGLCDAILVIGRGEKKVSSSAGHDMMEKHIFATQRYKQANKNLVRLMQAIKGNDLATFTAVLENEALTLHAMMMASEKGYVLLKPGSLHVIDEVNRYRDQEGVFLTYTIDAGPNIHLIYHQQDSNRVKQFIEGRLSGFLDNGYWIDDRAGTGPEKIR